MRLRIALPVLLAIAAQPAAAQAQVAGAEPVYVEDSRYIESADGTRLAISVFKPRRPGRYPVIVTQDRSESGERAPRSREFFVGHGYVVVAQDRRGTGASFGTQTGFVNREDVRDAKAVIEWAARQDFSTGSVGAMGCSNQGVWQYGVAALQPTGLKAIAPACASPAFFDNAVSLNGVPMFASKPSYYQADCSDAPAVASPPARPVATDRDGTLLRQALAQRGCTAPMLGQYWLNMPRDGWNAFALYRPAIDDSPITHWREIKESGVAILQLGGWFDAAVAGQLQGHALWGGRLVMGPWTHGNRVPADAGFPAGQLDLNDEMLRWFDHYLKARAENPPADEIQYYVINSPAGSAWRTTTSWPASALKARYYFDGTQLRPGNPSQPSAGAIGGAEVRWFGGRYAPLARWFAGDMAASDAASLVHTTEPLQADAELIGTPTVRLWLTSNDPDLNVYAVIEDVAPDGRSTYVTDGRIRASWRALASPDWGAVHESWHRGFASDLRALSPGEPVELVFDFFPIAYRFPAGHRIRVALTTSIGEAYQQPPSSRGAVPTAMLLRDRQHPSMIELPLQTVP